MKRQELTILLALFFLCLIGPRTVLANAKVTTSVTLDWAHATFSGPITTGSPNFFGTSAQAAGLNLTTGQFVGSSHDAPGWNPASNQVQFGPFDFSTAVADSEFDVATSNSGPYEFSAQIDRWGTIDTTNGNIEITVPFSMTATVAIPGPACFATGCYTVRMLGGVGLDTLQSRSVTGSGFEHFDRFGFLAILVRPESSRSLQVT